MTATISWPSFAAALDALDAAQDVAALGPSAAPLMQALGATLIGVASPLASPDALGVRLQLPVHPTGFSQFLARLTAHRSDVLRHMIVHRVLPFRLNEISAAEAELGQDRYTRLFAAHGLHEGLCVPRLAAAGGRELAILAGPALNLPDTASLAAARVFLEIFADRLHRLQSRGPAVRRSLLTPRQRDCLDAALRGANSIQIAAQLRLAPRTVDTYIAAAAARLGVANRTAAVGAAVRLGLIG